MRHEYDMIVIGGGAAGLVASGMAAAVGAKTALIEAHRLGGDCTWTGCVPSKSLLRAAHVAFQTRTADRYGLEPLHPSFRFQAVMNQVRSIRQHIYEDADAPPNLEKLGVEVISARAAFVDPHTVELVNGRTEKATLTARYFVIATGSRPRLPNLNVPVLTNESIFELTEQPRRLLVLGAGPVGIEMSQAFRRLGSEVTVVAPGRAILAKDDPELTGMLQKALAGEGIAFRLGHKVIALERRNSGLIATLDEGTTYCCDAVLAAIGREPAIRGMGLEAAGVAFDNKGVRVDRRCWTSQRHIYASGDVTGKYMFTHMAEHMSKVSVTNAILHVPSRTDDEHVTWCTFTEPELARLGASEDDVRQRGQTYHVYRFPFAKLDRAITERETTGIVKVVSSRWGRILGVSILGANAGEMIGEWQLPCETGLLSGK